VAQGANVIFEPINAILLHPSLANAFEPHHCTQQYTTCCKLTVSSLRNCQVCAGHVEAPNCAE
jgi:hypothetical protein